MWCRWKKKENNEYQTSLPAVSATAGGAGGERRTECSGLMRRAESMANNFEVL